MDISRNLDVLVHTLKQENRTKQYILREIVIHDNIYDILQINKERLIRFIDEFGEYRLDNSDYKLIRDYSVYCVYTRNRHFQSRDIIKALVQLKLGSKGAIKQYYWYGGGKRVVDSVNFHVNEDELWTVTPIEFKSKRFTFKLKKRAKEFPYYYTSHVWKQLFCGYSYIGNTDCKQIAPPTIRPRNDYYTDKYPQDLNFKLKIHELLQQYFNVTVIEFGGKSYYKTKQTNFRNNWIKNIDNRDKLLNEKGGIVTNYGFGTLSNLRSIISLCKNNREVFIHFNYNDSIGIESTVGQTDNVQRCKSDLVLSFSVSSSKNLKVELIATKELHDSLHESQISKFYYIQDCVLQQLRQIDLGNLTLTGNRNDAHQYELFYDRNQGKESTEIRRISSEEEQKLLESQGQKFIIKNRYNHYKKYEVRDYWITNVDVVDPRFIELQKNYPSIWDVYVNTGKLYVNLRSWHDVYPPRTGNKHWNETKKIFNKNLRPPGTPDYKKWTVQAMYNERDGVQYSIKYKKSFFEARHLWQKRAKEDGALRWAKGIRTDVDVVPIGIEEIGKDLKDIKIIPRDFNINLYSVNYYCGGNFGLGSHKDDKFIKSVFTYSVGSDSRLTFDKKINDTGIALFCVELPTFTVLEMKLDCFSGKDITHCVTKESLMSTRGVIIFREVDENVLNQAKKYTKRCPRKCRQYQ